MNHEDTSPLAASSAGFALAAAITVLFNTALACVKDASPALLKFMNSVTIHNWITQGLADLVLFFGLGLFFSHTGFAVRMAPNRLILFLVVAIILAGGGLFFWYLLF